MTSPTQEGEVLQEAGVQPLQSRVGHVQVAEACHQIGPSHRSGRYEQRGIAGYSRTIVHCKYGEITQTSEYCKVY
jgi:hypothetical protein